MKKPGRMGVFANKKTSRPKLGGFGAGEGNRTLVFSLGITIHPFYVDIQKVLQ